MDWKTGDIRTIQLGEHTWDLPPIPASRDILFFDQPKEDQYWHRQKFPKIFYDYTENTRINMEQTVYDAGKELISLSRADTDMVLEIREKELLRRIEGVWFMNNGVPTYLTGDHYFALQWCKIAGVSNPYDGNSSYGIYMEFQAKFFYFIQMCREDKKCLGGYVVKPKKTGVSMMLGYLFLNYATLTREKNLGTMSKSNEDNQRTCRKYFMDGFNGLPHIFRPAVLTDNKGKFEFNNDKKKKKNKSSTAEGYDTTIYFAPTKEDAFDGPVMHLIWYDEFPKYDDPYPQIVFDKGSKTVKLGEKLNGKVFITSYVNEKDGESFMQGRKIYMESKLNTRNAKTGKTASEMYCYAISALDSLTTDDIDFDKYGNISREALEAYIDAEREAKKHDPVALQRYIRQFPKNEEEAWRIGGGEGSVFDNARLSKRQSDLMEQLAMGSLPYTQGNLIWTGPRLASEVRFIPLTDAEIMAGKRANYRVYNIEIFNRGPLAGQFNVPFREKLKDDNGNYKPKITSPFIAATDPVSYSLKSDVADGSKCAITAMTFPNIAVNTYWGAEVTDLLFMRYLYRPQSPKEYYEEVVKMIWMLGCYIYPEANQAWVITMLKEDNLHNFILVRDSERKIVPYPTFGITKLPHADPKTIEDMIRMGEEYMVPANSPDKKDKIDQLDDEEAIKQLIEFKKTDTKKFDLAVCILDNIMAKTSFAAFRTKQEEHDSVYGSQNIMAAMKAVVY